MSFPSLKCPISQQFGHLDDVVRTGRIELAVLDLAEESRADADPLGELLQGEGRVRFDPRFPGVAYPLSEYWIASHALFPSCIR